MRTFSKNLWLLKLLARGAAAFVAAFLFTQCGATYYTPSNQNTGQLSEEKEIMASGGFSRVNQTEVIHYTAAYSPIKHLGIKLGGATFNAERDFSTINIYDNYGLDGQLIEGSVGYYRKLSENFVFDVYGGIGNFNGFTADAGLEGVDFNYNRFFIQPSFGVNSQYVDIILSLRLSNLNYASVQYGVGQTRAQDLAANYFGDSPFPLPGDDFYFIEPTFTMRVGVRQVKLEVQTGFAFNYSSRPLDYDPFHFGVGLVYNFKPSYREKPLNTDFLK
jgi:hypothetical protein